MKKQILYLVLLLGASFEVYSQSVKIGNQVWMTKNLDVDTFRNGDKIQEAKTDEEWKRAGDNKKPAWCYYNNEPTNGAKYGKLYNWYAINDLRGLAPQGWHIPAAEDWMKLALELGNDTTTGAKLKTTSGWGQWETNLSCSNCKTESEEGKLKCEVCRGSGVTGKSVFSLNGNNESGFYGLPGGARKSTGEFVLIGLYTMWWSTTEKTDLKAYYLDIDPGKKGKVRFDDSSKKAIGQSVRCLRD